MGLRSFKTTEGDLLATLPNTLTGIRAVGGITLGALLATNTIEPGRAFVAGTVLALTDFEGVLISATNRWPRLQNALRIHPSKIGRKADPIADKIFTMAVFIGGTIGGEIPLWQAGSILAAEVATSATTIAITKRGGEPETSKVGSVGMVTRCATIAANFGAAATEGSSHDVLAATGAGMAVASVVLGAISCWKIAHDTVIPSRVPTTQT